MAREDHQQNAVRRYLLQQLPEDEQRALELRLLTEDETLAELEIVEDELIDAYIGNELSLDERKSFEEHFCTTPAREIKLRSAQAMKRYLDNLPPDPSPKPGTFRRLLNWLGQIYSSPQTAAVSAMFFVVVGLAVWRVAFYQSDLDKGLIALNEAFRQERPVEARVSLLDYAPYGTTRSNEPKPVNTLELSRAQILLLQAEQDRRDAAAYHALGKFYLLQREPEKAIENLDRALKFEANDARIYADLGAALLEKAKLELAAKDVEGKALKDLGRSLENLKRALELDPDLLEPLFNLALVHESQGRTEAAKADWRAYLAKDPNSQWAVEARKNLKRLEDAQSRRSQDGNETFETFMRAYETGDDTLAWEVYRSEHLPSGNEITNTLINQFLAETPSARTTSENLQALMYLGQLELRKTNDAYTLDLARVYSSASPKTRALLATARQEVTRGGKLVDQAAIDEAMKLFANARSAFEKSGDVPELLAVERRMAHASAVQPNLKLGEEIVQRVVSACESRRYTWLLAETLTNRAHIQSNLNNYSDAIKDGNRAVQLFQDLHDVRSTLAAFVQLAALHLFLNDTEISFLFLRRAMAVAEAEGTPPLQLWGVHIAASLNLTALHLYRAALDYQNEALQLALQSRLPLIISRSYQWIGLTYGALQQFDLAFESLRNAYEQGKLLAHERNGQNMMANALLRLGDVHRLAGDHTGALAAYEESLRLYEGLQFGHYSYAAHKGKFLSYLAQNNDALAAQQMSIVFDLFNNYREKILAERQKNIFFDREQGICDLAIDFTYFRLGDRNRAFDYSEICRAPNLRKLMRSGAEVAPGASGFDLLSKPGVHEEALPLQSFTVSTQLPENVQLIQYAVLDKRVVIWLINRSGVFAESVEIEYPKLKELVANLTRQIPGRDDRGAAESLKILHTHLIEPIKARLDANKVICFVPDKVLHYVPFGALLSPDSHRYLAQDFPLMIAPSASILIESSRKASGWSTGQEERLLAVGNPTFDRERDPRLSDLPEAEREVKGIISDYPLRRVLVRRQATRKAVIEELMVANVAHFAAHYQIDARSTLSSKLLLTPELGDDAHSRTAGLDAGSIYQMNLAHMKLVILAACQTAIEQQFDGEGPIGFGRSFLVAGVPVVVASLWPVESDATAELMIAFHNARRDKQMPTTAALKYAQQEMIARESHHSPYYWAGFTVIGGYSDY